MANINIFGKILGSTSQFKKFIIDNIKQKINTRIFSKSQTMQSTIKSIVIESIRSQDEYTSLKYGRLRNALGIANPTDVDAILQQLEEMEIRIKKPTSSGSGIDARIMINMVQNGFADILASPAASYTSANGFQVNWLEWLLLRGNDSVVIGYRYSPQSSPYSRTGFGIMVKGNSSIFRVPEGNGTIDNNWITRGIDDALPKIESYMNSVVEESL